MTNEGKVLLGIGVVTLGLFIGGIFMLSKKNEPVTQAPVDPSVLVRENSPVTGAAEPVVTLVEFGDYQCPFCAQASPVVKSLLAAYPEKLAFVFRDFPLSQHKNAQVSAEAAHAAGTQGKYWEMHELLYARQGEWEASNNAGDIFKGYAEELGLDMATFSQELDGNAHRAFVQQGLIDGNQLGVNSTPTFYVNDVRFSGSMADLVSLIDALANQEATSSATPAQ